MAARLYDFLPALLHYWWVLVTGVVLVIEPLVESAVPRPCKTLLDRYWPAQRRYQHFRWASLAAVVVASFLAFDDVNMRNHDLEDKLQVSIGERDEARRQQHEAETHKADVAPLSPRQNSRFYWKPLSLSETLALRVELRNISRSGLPPPKIDTGRLHLTIAQVEILCNDGFCSDLAGSLVESFHGIGITADVGTALGANPDGFGIRPDNQTTRDVAAAIEKITNGRVLVSIGPGLSADERVVISIGRKTD